MVMWQTSGGNEASPSSIRPCFAGSSALPPNATAAVYAASVAGTLQTKQELYQIPTRHHESPIAAPIWLVLCDLVRRGRGARAVSWDTMAWTLASLTPTSGGFWVGLPVLS